ncbi:hypothetical protein GHU05_02440 [Fructobacillus tropaeoli]|uniref:hypothetical protein n=1 Tax=Fructobacillus tropaeoli TaxID=709323 RepID=UPI001455FD35|nr:hypothetical protein [Fructobacillus tropaeoli]NLS37792.1 hypothetical protein [Fructobacillus tropaeoli]
MANLPRDLTQISWQRTYIVSKNPKTGKQERTRPLLEGLKKEADQVFDAIVIATDTDPSGEGDLLAYEAIKTINGRGKVLRANFVDESEKGLKRALTDLKPIDDFKNHGPLQKGLARNQWDYASMQLTRGATRSQNKQGTHMFLDKED